MQYDDTEIENTLICYLPRLRTGHHAIYLCLVGAVCLALATLPFLYADISVKAAGIIRPSQERTDLKTVISGIVDSICCREGTMVNKNELILRIRDPAARSKRELNQIEISQRRQFIHDLKILTACPDPAAISSKLASLVYKEQAAGFIHQLAEREAMLRKANKELEMNSSLVKDRVISPKEFFDSQILQERTAAAYLSLRQQQKSSWQQELVAYELELSQYLEQQQQLHANALNYEIRCPVTGTIQGINRLYPGCLLPALETICSISPDGELVGESYVSSRNIGLIKLNQSVLFQVDAFDYNYFGVKTGRVISIDNDFTVEGNEPVFKVRCSFDSREFHLKNGFPAVLKKGMSFQSRFIIGRRSFWQLMFDKLDDWLNPAAPPRPKTN
ncbi:MAG TPA: HlyD family efflux transporter periplasmic adaptor subunit [Puia sp.]|nr:HlyD family efflux transporter periplasmic adaptor subunit [Puia sp.]